VCRFDLPAFSVYGWGMTSDVSFSYPEYSGVAEHDGMEKMYDAAKTMYDASAVPAAGSIVAGIDRTPLGRFAVDDELFYASVLKHTRAVERSMERSDDDDDFDEKFEIIPLPDQGGGFYAEVELAFLLDTYSPSMFAYTATSKAHVELLRLASSHPVEFHDYLAVGIRDAGYIGKCIAEGVDAELAAEALR